MFCHVTGGEIGVKFSDVNVKLYYENRRLMTLNLSRGCLSCHDEETQKYQDGAHVQTITAGNTEAPVCVDCHGGHEVSVPNNSRAEISQTCGMCHEQIFEEFKSSVHGEGLNAESNLDVPICIDCHGVHTVIGPEDATFRNDSVVICGNCHADNEKMAAYNLSTAVFETYLDDFHGRTVNLLRLDDAETPSNKAVCYDCHGIHDIRSPDDALSQVYPDNLQKTCQKCHAEADIKFPAAWLSHYVPTYENNPWLYLINRIYPIVIAVIFGSMVTFNSLDFFRHIKRKRVEAIMPEDDLE